MKKLLTITAMVFLTSSVIAQTERFVASEPIVDAEKTVDSIHYSATIYVKFSDTRGIIPSFQKDTVVVSSNYQTGFNVDADRKKAVIELIERTNK